MKVPTYLNGKVKHISFEDNFEKVFLSTSSGSNLFEIYYYGNIVDGYICSTEEKFEKIVAKSIDTGEEILIFDGAVHGYDNMFCVKHTPEELEDRELIKLDFGLAKVEVSLEYSIDYESEIDNYDFDDENNVILVNGEKMSWDDVKLNGITWISINLIDDKGKSVCIVDAELA